MSAQTVHVELGARSYPVWIGHNLLPSYAPLLEILAPYSQRFLIADEAVVETYAKPLQAALQTAGILTHLITVPSGESSKSFGQMERLCDEILEHQPDRKSVLIALGGGVIGDLVGLVASLLLRGVAFVQIPTTLLAMVDSSVGGKTAINSRAGKNLVGAFYQPKAVLADLTTLQTLPPREWNAGYAEVVKYGVIRDAAFYGWLEENRDALHKNDPAILTHAVQHCVAMKAAIVKADETEQDVRALLNFGHTLGHAIEAETGYSRVLHGEAVAVGMVLALKLSAHLGHCSAALAEQLTVHLRAMGLPATLHDIQKDWSIDALIKHCYGDKKAEHGRLTFVLVRSIGDAFVEKNTPEHAVREVLTVELA